MSKGKPHIYARYSATPSSGHSRRGLSSGRVPDVPSGATGDRVPSQRPTRSKISDWDWGGSFERCIQVGVVGDERRFGRVASTHLEVFGLRPELCSSLYITWLRQLEVAEEEGLPASLSDQAEAMYAAVRLQHSEVGFVDCYRWVYLMAVACDLEFLAKVDREPT